MPKDFCLLFFDTFFLALKSATLFLTLLKSACFKRHFFLHSRNHRFEIDTFFYTLGIRLFEKDTLRDTFDIAFFRKDTQSDTLEIVVFLFGARPVTLKTCDMSVNADFGQSVSVNADTWSACHVGTQVSTRHAIEENKNPTIRSGTVCTCIAKCSLL